MQLSDYAGNAQHLYPLHLEFMAHLRVQWICDATDYRVHPRIRITRITSTEVPLGKHENMVSSVGLCHQSQSDFSTRWHLCGSALLLSPLVNGATALCTIPN